jgi:hypothetical protein
VALYIAYLKKIFEFSSSAYWHLRVPTSFQHLPEYPGDEIRTIIQKMVIIEFIFYNLAMAIYLKTQKSVDEQ